MSSRASVVVAVGLAIAGCAEVGLPTGSVTDTPVAAPDVATPDTQPLPTGPHLTLVSGPFDVTPTEEQFTCTYTDVVADAELAVWSTTGEQVEHGHHVTLYFTTNPKPPQQLPCFSPDAMDKKLVAQAPTDTSSTLLALPEGAAFRIPKGAQLIIFSHYVNVTGGTFTANDSLHVWLREPAEVTTWMDSYTFSDDAFQVPPHAEAFESVTTCTVDRDLQVLLFIGHMHELGQRYLLEVIGADGQVKETLADDLWAPTFGVDPPVHWFSMEAPLVITAGTRLRQTCRWTNPGEGPAVFPTEMCLAAFTYFPGEGELFCKHD